MFDSQNTKISTNVLFFLLITFLALAGYILQPFLVPILLALIFTVTTYPVYKKVLNFCKGKSVLATALFLFCSFILLLLVVFSLSWLILGEVFDLKDVALAKLSIYAETWFDPNDWNKFITENTDKIKPIVEKIPFVNEATVTKMMESALTQASDIVKNVSTGIVGALRLGLGKIGAFFVNLLYFYLASFYFLAGGERILNRLFFLLPIKKKHIDEIITRFTSLFKSWVIGNIAIMLIQGTLGGIGFAIAGIPSPTVWGIIISFASLVPFIGTAAVMLPAALLLVVSGHYVAGIFLLAWGVGIVGTVDNFVRPIILKEGAHMSVLILLFALLGGWQVFGFQGLLLGPIIIVFLDVMLHIYSLEYGSFLKKLKG